MTRLDINQSCLRQGSALKLERKKSFDGGCLLWCFTESGAEGHGARCQNRKKNVSKTIEMKPKGTQNERMKLQRHSWGTWSEKYCKSTGKERKKHHNLGQLLDQNPSQSHNKSIHEIIKKINHGKTWKMLPKRCQKGTRSHSCFSFVA